MVVCENIHIHLSETSSGYGLDIQINAKPIVVGDFEFSLQQSRLPYQIAMDS